MGNLVFLPVTFNMRQRWRFTLLAGYFYSEAIRGLDEEMVRVYIRDQEKEDERYDQLKLDM